jgi:hypothetical protein
VGPPLRSSHHDVRRTQATYDIIVRRAEMHILRSERSGLDLFVGASPPDRLCALVEAFAREVAAYPNAARACPRSAPDVGPAAHAHTERTRRLVERAIYWSLGGGSNMHAPSPVAVKSDRDGWHAPRARAPARRSRLAARR